MCFAIRMSEYESFSVFSSTSLLAESYRLTYPQWNTSTLFGESLVINFDNLSMMLFIRYGYMY